MGTFKTALASAAVAAVFAVAGCAASYNLGEPPVIGTTLGGLIGFLIVTGVIYPRGKDDPPDD